MQSQHAAQVQRVSFEEFKAHLVLFILCLSLLFLLFSPPPCLPYFVFRHSPNPHPVAATRAPSRRRSKNRKIIKIHTRVSCYDADRMMSPARAPVEYRRIQGQCVHDQYVPGSRIVCRPEGALLNVAPVMKSRPSCSSNFLFASLISYSSRLKAAASAGGLDAHRLVIFITGCRLELVLDASWGVVLERGRRLCFCSA